VDAGFDAPPLVVDGGTSGVADVDGTALAPEASVKTSSADSAPLEAAADAMGSELDASPDVPVPDAEPDTPDARPTPYDGPTGTPDPSFGTSGVVTTADPDDGGSFNAASALAIDTNGTLVVAGSAVLADQVTWETAVARYHSDGTPDTSVASGGVLLTSFGLSTQPVAGGLAIQPDHGMLVSGYGLSSATVNGFYVARLDVTGALDTTFAANGLLTTSPPAGSYDGAYGLLLDSTGFLVAGWEGAGSASNFALWRFGLSAAPDSTFGTGGKVTTILGASMVAHATQLARQSTQKIVVAGSLFDPTATTYDAAVVRYTAAGALDTTFGTGGVALSGQTGDASATAIAIQPDDRILVAGYTTVAQHSQITLWRLTADGSLDPTFGTSGKAVFTFTQLGGRASSVALQGDGRIVIAGDVYPLGAQNMVVFRVLPGGTLDPSFGNVGAIVSTSSVSDFANVVAVQADGSIVVAGTSNYGELTLWCYR
jgi:uncharacterized delta-60 repeat protein